MFPVQVLCCGMSSLYSEYVQQYSATYVDNDRLPLEKNASIPPVDNICLARIVSKIIGCCLIHCALWLCIMHTYMSICDERTNLS